MVVSRSGCDCDDVGWLNVGQNTREMVWNICIWVSIGV
jgi:hypothetical protein